MAESYEREPPRSYEMLGAPVLNPRTAREPDAATGEECDPGAVSGDYRRDPPDERGRGVALQP